MSPRDEMLLVSAGGAIGAPLRIAIGFSTFTMDAVRLGGRAGARYVGISVGGGLLAATTGLALASI